MKFLEIDIAPCFTDKAFATLSSYSPVVLNPLALDVAGKHISSHAGHDHPAYRQTRKRFGLDSVSEIVRYR
jgi:hypothetical protein